MPDQAVSDSALLRWQCRCGVARPVAELGLAQRCAVASACGTAALDPGLWLPYCQGRLCLHFLSGAVGMVSLMMLVRRTKWHCLSAGSEPQETSGGRNGHVPSV